MGFIANNKQTWLFFIFFVLVVGISFAMGFITHMINVNNQDGIQFNCNGYTSKQLGRNSCSANITMPYNITIQIVSNFDELKILRNEV